MAKKIDLSKVGKVKADKKDVGTFQRSHFPATLADAAKMINAECIGKMEDGSAVSGTQVDLYGALIYGLGLKCAQVIRENSGVGVVKDVVITLSKGRKLDLATLSPDKAVQAINHLNGNAAFGMDIGKLNKAKIAKHTADMVSAGTVTDTAGVLAVVAKPAAAPKK